MKLKRSYAIILFFLLLAFYMYFFKINNILEPMATLATRTPYTNCNKTKCYQMCQRDSVCLQGHDECSGCNIESSKLKQYNPVVITDIQGLENNAPLLDRISPSVIIINGSGDMRDDDRHKNNRHDVDPNGDPYDNVMTGQGNVPVIHGHDPMFIPQQRTTGMLTDIQLPH